MIVWRVYVQIRAAVLGRQLINVVGTSSEFMNSGLNMSDMIFFQLSHDTANFSKRSSKYACILQLRLGFYKHCTSFISLGNFTLFVDLLTQPIWLAQCWTL